MCASLAHVVSEEYPFARHFVHAGMVGLDGEKMSKSRGNLVFVSQLRQEVPPAAIRLALLAHHYRDDWEWTPRDLDNARARLSAWTTAVRADTAPPAGPLLAEVRCALADDLDAPSALAAIDRWAEKTRRGHGDDAGAPASVADVAASLLGVETAQDSGSRRRR